MLRRLKLHDLVSIDDLSVPQIFEIFKLVPKMRKLVEHRKIAKTLEGQIIALLFLSHQVELFHHSQRRSKDLADKPLNIRIRRRPHLLQKESHLRTQFELLKHTQTV